MALISWPPLNKPDTEKAKQIVCAIIHASGGSFGGRTRLYKAFYLAHLVHWRDNKGILSQYPIVRMPNGPGVDAGDLLLGEMLQAGVIRSDRRPSGPYTENVYYLTPNVEAKLDSDEIAAVDLAVKLVTHRTGTDLSELTHEHSRSWNGARDGDIIDVYVDALADDEYEDILRHQRQARGLVDSVFGGRRCQTS